MTTTAKTDAPSTRRKSSRKDSVEEATPTETSPVDTSPALDTSPAEESPATASEAETPSVEPEPVQEPIGRDRIQQQLEALKQREAELRRELAIADHPELADAIRTIEGSAYGVSRVEAKMAEGLSKAELRRKETLEKKLASAREKRAEMDAQIAALEMELTPLGEARAAAFDAERTQALLTLVALLGQHDAALRAASLDVGSLVPTLANWQTEIDALRARADA
jgi:chromosome segregation ATPase